ncbi:MAG: 50S ribosomal protein L22 [Clostridiales bacterium]|jgi:large subunit ribosomal protein L22|nr:50S ribosomal protein L22 [Clostridiales bacterium]HOC08565.1 50S ribosomal protein L22 [Bacillota bacterium]HZX47512.1 50S ribosomal protein L22 [Clostridia bacterium]HOO12404.1 50S ribosomal protein L22 [Bacillota bacterium]HQA48379.1 50S ribosomal protein L22 [Bacillota bacterium]
MEAKAHARYIRISPRKVEVVLDQVRGKSIDEALAILRYMPQKGARITEKLIQSAAANAENNHDMVRDNLYVAQIYANQGPTMKRYKARAQGRANLIRKRSTHISVVLREKQ